MRNISAGIGGQVGHITVNGPADDDLSWDAIDWRCHEGNVRRLRQRIFTAVELETRRDEPHHTSWDQCPVAQPVAHRLLILVRRDSPGCGYTTAIDGDKERHLREGCGITSA